MRLWCILFASAEYICILHVCTKCRRSIYPCSSFFPISQSESITNFGITSKWSEFLSKKGGGDKKRTMPCPCARLLGTPGRQVWGGVYSRPQTSGQFHPATRYMRFNVYIVTIYLVEQGVWKYPPSSSEISEKCILICVLLEQLLCKIRREYAFRHTSVN